MFSSRVWHKPKLVLCQEKSQKGKERLDEEGLRRYKWLAVFFHLPVFSEVLHLRKTINPLIKIVWPSYQLPKEASGCQSRRKQQRGVLCK